jgi:glycosyltransferase involved in cell wall biosynthesis
MPDAPAISVLMTAFNSQAYIVEAIQSILNQTFTKFEFIILDDASTDGTWEIINKYASKDQRIIALKNEKNLGISGSRNRLVNLAKGEFIIWQDADDISLPSRLEKQYQFMINHPQVGISGGGLEFFEGNKILGTRKYALTDSELRKKIFRYSPVAQPAAIVRTRALKNINGYNPKLSVAEDLDVAFRLGQNYQFANLPEIVLRYRHQKNSITFQKLKILEINTLKIRYYFLKNPAYHPSILDIIYNLLQLATLFLMPSSLRVYLFNHIRNS